MNSKSTEQANPLYLRLRQDLCRKIFDGLYDDGAHIPPKRELAKQYGVSRVTVRKTQGLLEEEGLVVRTQGSGTRIRLRRGGTPNPMEIVALVAPATNPFFSLFIHCAEAEIEPTGAFVMLKLTRADGRITLNDYLFRLFQKNIRDAVIWSQDQPFDPIHLQRLRGLGMNLVLFDTIWASPFVDNVCLHNDAAVRNLYTFCQRQGCRNIAYLGWDNQRLSSVREREAAFVELASDTTPYRLVWDARDKLETKLETWWAARQNDKPDACFCADGDIGIALRKYLIKNGKNQQLIVCIDDLPEAAELGLTVYAQPMEKLARTVYECLIR